MNLQTTKTVIYNPKCSTHRPVTHSTKLVIYEIGLDNLWKQSCQNHQSIFCYANSYTS